MSEHRERVDERWWTVPRPPWFSYLLFVVAGLGTGIWRALSTHGGALRLFVQGFLWPGLAIAAAVFIVAYLGWTLDLE